MSQNRFNQLNNILGWLVLLIASFVYLSTIEPTVSLWDCGEFIAGSYKLEVVHPPGAPFFLMLNRLFTIFVPAESGYLVPIIVNGSSAMASAFTVLFLFWSISLLARKIILKGSENISDGQAISVLGASLVGALAFTFSDTFWFSAVEGEVYALSIFFTSLVFWLLLKWERRANEPNHLRWLILVFYLMGLSIGVHLLSLLALPVMAFVYYFKKYDKITVKGTIVAFFVGMILLAVINTGIIKWIPIIASKFELLFVNSFGMPYWSGVIFTIFLIFGILAYGIYYTHKTKRLIMNTAFVGMLVVFIGYNSYTMVAIRSLADTPIDYSNPDNIFNMISYINREQYGERPIFYGPQFTARSNGVKEGRMDYTQKNGKYIPTERKKKPKFKSEDKTLFPRMSDMSREDRMNMYRTWTDMSKSQKKPTFGQNISFFIKYQLGHMYWRYFAWNFIGRQNDEQGHGKFFQSGFLTGNWVSGIPFIDKALVGNQENLPYEQQVNKAHNKLFFLPFILGLIGLFYHIKKDKKGAATTGMLFLVTGILLIVYQNSPPFEPRERDYTLVGSFMAFSMWIGLGVLGIINFLKDKMNLKIAAVLATVVSLVAVPVLMASQEWDDHDRSGRYTSRDFGLNYLNSCPPNAILFTNGDNDTYPLWYAQEVEGKRTDVRVINLQLLNTAWYVDQLREKRNESPAIKFSFTKDQIVGEKRAVVYYSPGIPEVQKMVDPNNHYTLDQVLEFIGREGDGGRRINYLSQYDAYYHPFKKMKIPVDKEEVRKYNVVREELMDRVVDEIKFSIGKERHLYKSNLMLLDIINNNLWERPICFAITSGGDTYMGLQRYFQQEGMVYHLVPIRSNEQERQRNQFGEEGRVDPYVMHQNVMGDFKFGRLKEPDVDIESVARRHCTNYRSVFGTLARAWVFEGESDSALKVINKGLEEFPEDKVPFTGMDTKLVDVLYSAQKYEDADSLSKRIAQRMIQKLEYLNSLDQKFQRWGKSEVQRSFGALEMLVRMSQAYSQNEEHKTWLLDEYNRLGNMFNLVPQQQQQQQQRPPQQNPQAQPGQDQQFQLPEGMTEEDLQKMIEQQQQQQQQGN
jgi:hypothetical protein